MIKYLFPFVLILAACTSEEYTVKKDSKPPVVVLLANEEEMDERIVEINAIVDHADLIANSLRYSKEDGSVVEVMGYMNTDNTILKITEVYSDGEGKNTGTKTFYLNGSIPFVAHEEYDEVINNTGTFVDRITYFDAKGNPLKTKERRAGFQDDVNAMPYIPSGLTKVSIDRAMNALNSTGEFTTTFQGFVDQGASTYLIVGANVPNGFTSSLRCDYKDQLIQVLLSNPQAYLGEKLRVNFQKYTAENGFQFQIYSGGKFIEK